MYITSILFLMTYRLDSVIVTSSALLTPPHIQYILTHTHKHAHTYTYTHSLAVLVIDGSLWKRTVIRGQCKLIRGERGSASAVRWEGALVKVEHVAGAWEQVFSRTLLQESFTSRLSCKCLLYQTTHAHTRVCLSNTHSLSQTHTHIYT